jgi:biopolymer transport protein ExbD
LFKRPSSRRRGESRQIELNLVPILDTMVTLIAFLLFTTSFFAVVSIESPFPETSADALKKKLTDKPLQLSLTLSDKEVEIWSPFERIPPKHIPNPAAGQPDVRAVHDYLVAVKQKFPQETKIVFAPFSGATYETMIGLMDTVRVLEKTDPPIYVKNKSQVDEPLKLLFPDVIFGNLLGDS